MLFNSFEFVLGFLPLALVGFFAIARFSRRAAANWLLVASLVFYAWWNPKFVLLLLASAAFNFAMGRRIAQARDGGGEASSRPWLAFAVAADLLLLGYFKYANFFISAVNDATGLGAALVDIALPLGISFFTFTQIAFLVDVHRGLVRDYDPLHYLLFVSYFPHLIAGPVLHHAQMMPQLALEPTYRPDATNLHAGITLFALGLFKKTVLADELALQADPMFDGAAQGGDPTAIAAWLGVTAYALQLYFDFSGYSDMAMGLSRLFNVRLPVNFDSPYKATSIIDFWRRWHMTLSAFLRDYLYVPLGGNRAGKARRYWNVMITMVLGGLWHGAAWTFVLWGALHGLFLIVNHAWRAAIQRLGIPRIPGAALLGGVVTFLAVVVAWVPFRADGMDAAARVLAGMAGVHGVGVWPAATALALLAACLAVVFALPNAVRYVHAMFDDPSGVRGWRHGALAGIGVGILLFAAVKMLARADPSPFLYFNF